MTEAHRDDTYAAVNPQRKIPALVTPAGETLTEFFAIFLTLEAVISRALTARSSRGYRRFAGCVCRTEIYPMVEINDYPSVSRPERRARRAQVALEVACAPGRSSRQKSPATRIYCRPGFASRTSTSPSSAAGHSKRHGGQTIFAKWKR